MPLPRRLLMMRWAPSDAQPGSLLSARICDAELVAEGAAACGRDHKAAVRQRRILRIVAAILLLEHGAAAAATASATTAAAQTVAVDNTAVPVAQVPAHGVKTNLIQKGFAHCCRCTGTPMSSESPPRKGAICSATMTLPPPPLLRRSAERGRSGGSCTSELHWTCQCAALGGGGKGETEGGRTEREAM